LPLGLVVSAVVAAAGGAAADGGDRAAAQALVTQIEGDAAHKGVTADAIARAKDALERGARLRSTGDEAHARAADGLALEWAETARDIARAVDAEAAATERRRKAVEAQAQLERTRALVEEGIARVGRLKAELKEAERGPKDDRKAVEVHDDSPHATSPARPARPKGAK
jgi:hypothetical protein